jgi:AcrR family transcriptional regulator
VPVLHTKRGPYAKGVERREAILATTARLMEERGFRKTTLRAIGRELGLQPAHVLYYFESRERLLEAAIEAWDARYLELRGDSGAAPSPLAIWLRLIEANALAPGMVHLYTAFAAEAADPNHPSRPFFQARWDRIRQALAADLAHGESTGRYTLDRTPDAAAAALIAYSDGLQLQWLVDRSVDMRASIESAIASMIGIDRVEEIE